MTYLTKLGHPTVCAFSVPQAVVPYSEISVQNSVMYSRLEGLMYSSRFFLNDFLLQQVLRVLHPWTCKSILSGHFKICDICVFYLI